MAANSPRTKQKIRHLWCGSFQGHFMVSSIWQSLWKILCSILYYHKAALYVCMQLWISPLRISCSCFKNVHCHLHLLGVLFVCCTTFIVAPTDLNGKHISSYNLFVFSPVWRDHSFSPSSKGSFLPTFQRDRKKFYKQLQKQNKFL